MPDDDDFDDIREIGRQRTLDQFARLILISDLITDNPLPTTKLLAMIVEDRYRFDDYADLEVASQRRKLERDLQLLESVANALGLDLRVDRNRKPHQIWYEGPRRIVLGKDKATYASRKCAYLPKEEGAYSKTAGKSFGSIIREALADRFPGLASAEAMSRLMSG